MTEQKPKLYFERTEEQLQIALDFIRTLKKTATEKGWTKLETACDKCLKRITEV